MGKPEVEKAGALTARWVRAGSAVTAGVLLLAMVDLLLVRGDGGRYLWRTSTSWIAGLVAFGVLGGAAGLACLAGLLRPVRLLAGLQPAYTAVKGLPRPVAWALAGLLMLAPPLMLLGPWGELLRGEGVRALVLLIFAGGAGVLWPAGRLSAGHRLGLAGLITATLFAVLRWIPQITDYPFALGWSEGNRLWDYSLYFEQHRYQVDGQFTFPTYLAPGRHLLWGLPYLIPDIGITWLRLWDAVLWTVPYALMGLALFTTERLPGTKWLRASIVVWVFLFVSQGPIYVPLVLSAALVFWLYDDSRPGRTALITALACFYAGMSRWTWLVAPAVWAVLWSVFDGPVRGRWADRWRKPAAYAAAGLLGAAASQLFMAWAFPREDAVFATALNQPLLLYRLLPNATNSLGILLGLVLAIGPPLGLIGWFLRAGKLKWDLLRTLVFSAAFLAFLGTGLAASLKIGGGNNLHNMDMLLILVVLVGGLMILELRGGGETFWTGLPFLPRALLVLTLAIPAWMALRAGGPVRLPSPEQEAAALRTIQEVVADRAKAGEVLFIDQRQLFTFGQVEGIPLILDYELKHVMNQAMGSNEAYFERFERDLASGRFSLIVSDPLNIIYQGRTHSFGEENDAWVDHVAVPLLEYYEPTYELREVGVWLLEPKGGS